MSKAKFTIDRGVCTFNGKLVQANPAIAGRDWAIANHDTATRTRIACKRICNSGLQVITTRVPYLLQEQAS